MTKQTHTELRKTLQNFKKGHKLPEGYTAVFNANISEVEIHGNTSRDAGKKIGTTKEYHPPFYDVLNSDNEIAFMIECVEDNKILIMGDANCEEVKTWKEAMKIGLEYEREGY